MINDFKIIGNSAKAGVRFVSYEYIKKLFEDEKGNLSKPRLLLAGLSAGVCEALLVVTISETIKTKLIDDRNSSTPKFKGLIHGTKEIIKSEGISGIYRGATAVVARQAANQGARLTIYSLLKQYTENKDSDGKVTLIFHLLNNQIYLFLDHF